MGQSLTKIIIHLIYSTKNRQRLILPDIEEALHAYKVGIFRDLDCPSLLIGGTDDHIHALFLLSKNQKLKDVIQEVKQGSSKWIKEKGREFSSFYWQSGYGAFSVSESGLEQAKTYIRNQKEHHRKVTFRDELRAFCILEKYGIDYDERYVWD